MKDGRIQRIGKTDESSEYREVETSMSWIQPIYSTHV